LLIDDRQIIDRERIDTTGSSFYTFFAIDHPRQAL
jgi:hypothetical protein